MTWAEVLGFVLGFAGTRRATRQAAPRGQRWVGDDARDTEDRSPGDHALWLLGRIMATLPTLRGSGGAVFDAWVAAWGVWAAFTVVFAARRREHGELLDVLRRVVELRDAPAYLTSGTAVAAVEWVTGYLRRVAAEGLAGNAFLAEAAVAAVEAHGAFVVEGFRAGPCMWCGGDHSSENAPHAPDGPGWVTAAGVPWAAPPGAAPIGVEVWGVRYATRDDPAQSWSEPTVGLVALHHAAGVGWFLLNAEAFGMSGPAARAEELVERWASRMGSQVMLSRIYSPAELVAMAQRGEVPAT